jgi:hypothetical protein
MDAQHIAVINESDNLIPGDLAKAVAAVQRQVTEDFGPVWDVAATVTAVPSLNEMPLGYWPVVIRDEIGINEPGVHLTEAGDKPFALVLFTGKDWTITLSHELLELLVDPLGTNFRSGPSIRDDQGDVQYLAEVCDPCQSDGCAYPVNGDQLVSDFVTPAFYGGVGPGPYSFRGNIKAPRQVLAGGYMTWRDPLTGQLWQLLDVGNGPEYRTIAPEALRPDVRLRGVVDRDTARELVRRRKGVRKRRPSAQQKRLRQQMDRYAAAAKSEAAWWRRQIDRAGATP